MQIFSLDSLERNERNIKLLEILRSLIFPVTGGETGPDSGQPLPGGGRAMRWEDLEQALQESTSRGLYQSVVTVWSTNIGPG